MPLDRSQNQMSPNPEPDQPRSRIHATSWRKYAPLSRMNSHHPELDGERLRVVVPDGVDEAADGQDYLAAVLPEGDDVVGADHGEEGRLDVRMRAEEAV